MGKSTKPAATAPDPKRDRVRALAAARRDRILEVAREAFFELGLDKASLREIARRAGYTPAALYSYFANKEALYAALLAESLDRLNAAVADSVAADGADPLQAAAAGFFEFYRANPRDLDLGFYLFQGVGPAGLTRELNRRLNRRLNDALDPVRRALAAGGLAPASIETETAALFAQMSGLLLLEHTGRIRLFGQQSTDLLQAYVDRLRQRLAPAT